MAKLITKVELPIYGEFYIVNIEGVSAEAIQALQKPLKKLYEYEQKYEEDEN